MQNQTSDKVVVMDFSEVYEKEKFYKKEKINWIDCTDIHGKNCYCDSIAQKKIRKRIKHVSPQGIHFIDSGNYHYVSEFFTDKLKEPFVLIVFDHHSDIQKPMFEDLLSCGSWILNVMEQNSFLMKVVLIGADEQQILQIPPKYLPKLEYVNNAKIRSHSLNKQKINLEESYPVYISIDKDVLSEKIVETNWSQGDMNWSELKNVLHEIIRKNQVIGIDICGECEFQMQKIYDLEQDDEVNQNLLHFFKKEILHP